MAGGKMKEHDGASPAKIFIGGLPKDTTMGTFKEYFGKYGEIVDAVIMKDRFTQKPRGFGFITFADPAVVDRVIEDNHVINGKEVEIKRTIPKGAAPLKDFKTKKIFVGGLPSALKEDEFKEFFSKFGKVVEHEIIRDHSTNRSRGFGFVVFDAEKTVDELLAKKGNMIDLNGSQATRPSLPSPCHPLRHADDTLRHSACGTGTSAEARRSRLKSGGGDLILLRERPIVHHTCQPPHPKPAGKATPRRGRWVATSSLPPSLPAQPGMRVAHRWVTRQGSGLCRPPTIPPAYPSRILLGMARYLEWSPRRPPPPPSCRRRRHHRLVPAPAAFPLSNRQRHCCRAAIAGALESATDGQIRARPCRTRVLHHRRRRPVVVHAAAGHRRPWPTQRCLPFACGHLDDLRLLVGAATTSADVPLPDPAASTVGAGVPLLDPAAFTMGAGVPLLDLAAFTMGAGCPS
ncbi:hypothetical protein OsJ_07373 [Oryza sativa Japonica Group]|uniref:RRM domain-containing protein n=1 Tax=Oryza sativa subsp. japonica TaxID=39947 RepID=B9F0V6_ORYSJ|nr:hypothetical protein OsJ_07373 [Oryza sativa Japonica Group]